MPDPIGQQARWLELMEEYSFAIEHRPGKKHANADALSRKPCRQCTIEEEIPNYSAERNLRVHAIRTEQATPKELPSKHDGEFFLPEHLREDYEVDPTLATFYKLFKEAESLIPWEDVVGLDKITKTLWTQRDRLCIVDGVIYRKWSSIIELKNKW